MKKLFSLYSLALVLILSSCIEQNYPIFERHIVEFQDAVVRTPVAGQVYPRITVPNTIGTVSLQVGLVGAHKPADEVIQYTVGYSERIKLRYFNSQCNQYRKIRRFSRPSSSDYW